MSRPDLLDQLRAARPVAPEEVRELVRRIAAEAAEPEKPVRRLPQLTWRRVLVVALPVAAAAGAAVLLSGGARTAGSPGVRGALQTFSPTRTHATAGAAAVALPSPAPNRVQRISTTLDLRVGSTQALSAGTKQAVAIAHALGGYSSSLQVNAAGRFGYASIVLRIPKQHLQAAMTRLSALGTIIGENVSIHDLTGQVDATARKIARLEAQLKAWQEQFQTPETQRHIAALSDQIGRLRRGRAATIHAASFATVALQLTTRPVPAPAHHGHGPLHDLGIAFRWLGIGAVYALALAAPFVLIGALVWLVARAVRRHRENELLSSP